MAEKLKQISFPESNSGDVQAITLKSYAIKTTQKYRLTSIKIQC